MDIATFRTRERRSTKRMDFVERTDEKTRAYDTRLGVKRSINNNAYLFSIRGV